MSNDNSPTVSIPCSNLRTWLQYCSRRVPLPPDGNPPNRVDGVADIVRLGAPGAGDGAACRLQREVEESRFVGVVNHERILCL